MIQKNLGNSIENPKCSKTSSPTKQNVQKSPYKSPGNLPMVFSSTTTYGDRLSSFLDQHLTSDDHVSRNPETSILASETPAFLPNKTNEFYNNDLLQPKLMGKKIPATGSILAESEEIRSNPGNSFSSSLMKKKNCRHLSEWTLKTQI